VITPQLGNPCFIATPLVHTTQGVGVIRFIETPLVHTTQRMVTVRF